MGFFSPVGTFLVGSLTQGFVLGNTPSEKEPALILADWRGSQKKYHPTNRKAR